MFLLASAAKSEISSTNLPFLFIARSTAPLRVTLTGPNADCCGNTSRPDPSRSTPVPTSESILHFCLSALDRLGGFIALSPISKILSGCTLPSPMSPTVQLNQLAISDKTAEATLYVSPNLNVDHRAYPVDGEARDAIPIQTVRLDDYFKTGDRVDLIKMDIQGYELHALRGAERVLRENAHIKLLLELWPYGLKQAGTTWNDLIAHLQDRGFDLQEISPTGLSPFSCLTQCGKARSGISIFSRRVKARLRASASASQWVARRRIWEHQHQSSGFQNSLPSRIDLLQSSQHPRAFGFRRGDGIRPPTCYHQSKGRY